MCLYYYAAICSQGYLKCYFDKYRILIEVGLPNENPCCFWTIKCLADQDNCTEITLSNKFGISDLIKTSR